MSWMDGPFQTIYFPCEHAFNNDGFQLAPQQCPVCAEEAEDAEPQKSWKRDCFRLSMIASMREDFAKFIAGAVDKCSKEKQ